MFAMVVSFTYNSITFLPRLFKFEIDTDTCALNSCNLLFTKIILSAIGNQSFVNNEN